MHSYYLDFVFQREAPDGSLKYVIVEVKADNQIEDVVVQAKKGIRSADGRGKRNGIPPSQVVGRKQAAFLGASVRQLKYEEE